MAHEKNHDYHILNPSIWPLLSALGAFIMLFGAVMWMQDNGPWMFLIGFVGVLYCMYGSVSACAMALSCSSCPK